MIRELKNPQNPFLILLLTEFIKDETRFVFGKSTAKNIERYIAIPRTTDQTTKAKILSAEKKLESIEGAHSAVHWTITEGGFNHTFNMLDKIAARLTFYCTVNSYEEFVGKYFEIAKHYEHYKTQRITDKELWSLQKQVMFFFKEASIYLEQSGVLDGCPHSNIVKLKDHYIARLPVTHELQLWDMHGFINAVNETQQSVIWRNRTLRESLFVLIDPFNSLVGSLKLINCEIVGYGFNSLTHLMVIMTGDQCKFDSVFVQELNGRDSRSIRILYSGLTDILNSIGHTTQLNPIIFMASKLERFEELNSLFGFCLFNETSALTHKKFKTRLLVDKASASNDFASIHVAVRDGVFYFSTFNDLHMRTHVELKSYEY